jgi:hypothetical protein
MSSTVSTCHKSEAFKGTLLVRREEELASTSSPLVARQRAYKSGSFIDLYSVGLALEPV